MLSGPTPCVTTSRESAQARRTLNRLMKNGVCRESEGFLLPGQEEGQAMVERFLSTLLKRRPALLPSHHRGDIVGEVRPGAGKMTAAREVRWFDSSR